MKSKYNILNIRKKKSMGFTLLEILVALAIFSICTTTIIKATSYSIKYTNQLKIKMYASIIADNSIETLRTKEKWPDLGTNETRLKMFNLQWNIKTHITETSHDHLRKVRVEIFLTSPSHTFESKKQSVSRTAFLGEHSF